MARELHSDILINAPAERVWQIVTDLERYADWNPFIPRASGRIAPGERIRIEVQPAGLKPVRFRPKVLHVEPGRSFYWEGRLALPGLFTGRHHFELHQNGGGSVRFVQWEQFSGLLLPLIWRRIAEPTRQGYHLMNAAVKQRAEERY
jgi:hypothetical protein